LTEGTTLQPVSLEPTDLTVLVEMSSRGPSFALLVALSRRADSVSLPESSEEYAFLVALRPDEDAS
jgi:hypothetical protein